MAAKVRPDELFGSGSSGRSTRILKDAACVRGARAGLYRLALNGRIRSDEMTRFIYTLKEIRACLEAEILTDMQYRLALLSRETGNHNGHRVLHQPTSSAVDLLEKPSQLNRPLKVVRFAWS